MDKTVDELLNLWGHLKNVRSQYEQGWENITRFCAPDRDFWSITKEHSFDTPRHIFDGTPMSAVNIMANALQGYMASKQTKSFKVGLESYRTLSYKPFEGRMRKYLQDLEDGMYWMINRSNFYDVISEIFRVGGTIGTACVYVDVVPGEDRVVNLLSHPSDIWISENASRIVDTEIRRIPMTAKDMVSRWGSKLSKEFHKGAKINPYKIYDVLHFALPRDTRDVTKIDNLNKPFASYWVYAPERILLHTSGFDENPYIAWRWSTPNNATYGWSPSHTAMAEVLRMNKISKTMMDAAELSVFPALNVPAEQNGKLDLRARGMNPYVDPSRIVKPIQQTGSYPIGRDREQALEVAIREHYMVDMFLMMNQYADTKRTATEVMEMQSEKATILGAVTSRIESELFDPLFDRYFEIGMKQGWLPSPPPEVYEALQGSELKIDYIGPMSQIQQRFYQNQNLAPVNTLLSYAQFMPEVLDVLDPTELALGVVNDSNLPQPVIRDRKVIEQIRSQRAQMQQAQAQANTAQMNARALKDMSQAGVEGL